MSKVEFNDTIAAIATSVGEGGIGIVRISGIDSLAIADKIFISRNKKNPSEFRTYTTNYGWISDRSQSHKVAKSPDEKNIIDEVLLTVMRAPKSYTKEDVVEINCHGGIVATRAVLELVLQNGARLAEPGEFTKRAFLNGRIDLAQAEAVIDIIRAKTDSALKISIEQLKGALSKEINNIRDSLIKELSVLEANIDFPEEDIDKADLSKIGDSLKQAADKLKKILDESKRARIFREGVHAVICGRPNVGKSSLLNALLKRERSIVSAVAGTTRDTIEEVIDIKGIPVRIVDTAGILEPRDLLEKKAVERSKEQIKLADIVILIFDASARLNKDDEVLIRKLAKKNCIAVLNKVDLKQRIDKKNIIDRFKYLVEISAKKAKNLNLLEDIIEELVCKNRVSATETVMVSSLRHIEKIRQAQILIAQAANSLDNRLSLEFVAQDIKDALQYLDNILGKEFKEFLLDKIFSEFCIGK